MGWGCFLRPDQFLDHLTVIKTKNLLFRPLCRDLGCDKISCRQLLHLTFISIGPEILRKAGNTHFKLLKCKFSRKLKVFVTNGGFIEKNSLFSINTTFTFLEKNSNPEYWVLEKKRFLETKLYIHSKIIYQQHMWQFSK